MSVTQFEWYEAENNRESFLLFEVLPTFADGKATWVRLERYPRAGALKTSVRTKLLTRYPLVGDTAILSKEKHDLLGAEHDTFSLKETVDQTLPLSFVLDILDAVPENVSYHSGSYVSAVSQAKVCRPDPTCVQLSNSQLYVSIVMNAVHQFCAPIDISSKEAASTHPNNPYRILRNVADRKACDDLAHEIELQQEWELL